MEHDPKCPKMDKQLISAITCSYCQVIRSVRQEYEARPI